MATDPNRPAPTEVSPEAPGDSRAPGDDKLRPPQGRGYARLAKRISSVTTKCLLTALVLVAGLAFGGQVLRWWAADTRAPQAASTAADALHHLGDPTRMHEMHFGDRAWSLRRQSIAGNKQAALAALRAGCREVLSGDLPPDRQPGEAESGLLGQLAKQKPVEEAEGKWRIYQLDQAFPMVLGTRPREDAADSQTQGPQSGPASRVAAWGMAIPNRERVWTLYTFQPRSHRSPRLVDVPDVPMPPECTRTLAITVAGGGATLTFEGPRPAKSWIEFYDRWFRSHNWEAAGEWRRSGGGWHGRYRSPTKSGAATVDVHFGPDGRGRLAGMVLVSGSGERQSGDRQSGDKQGG